MFRDEGLRSNHLRLWKTLRILLSVYWSSIPACGMDDLVLLRRQDSLWTMCDMPGRPYFMFVVHISHFSFLKAVLAVTGLGQPYNEDY